MNRINESKKLLSIIEFDLFSIHIHIAILDYEMFMIHGKRGCGMNVHLRTTHYAVNLPPSRFI